MDDRLATLSGIELVWVGLAGLYGVRFTGPFGSDPYGPSAALWRASLGDLSDEALRHGLEACVAAGEDWPPTAPAYRALCLSVLTLDEVRLDLRRANEERHPFTRMVWSVMDIWAFTKGDDFRARDALASAYAVARKSRMRGEPLPPSDQLALPRGMSAVEAARPNPAKMTSRGQQIADALARQLHPDRGTRDGCDEPC